MKKYLWVAVFIVGSILNQHAMAAKTSQKLGKSNAIEVSALEDLRYPDPESNTALWKIVKEGQETSYLLGSYHLGKAGNPWFPFLAPIFEKTNQLVVESTGYELSLNNMNDWLRLAAKKDVSSKVFFGAERRIRILDYLENRYEHSRVFLESLDSHQLIIMLEASHYGTGLSYEEGIDNFYIDYATVVEKPVIPLESRWTASSYLDLMPTSCIRANIDIKLQHPYVIDEQEKLYGKLYLAYIQNNPKKLLNIMNQENKKLLALSDNPKALKACDVWLFNSLLRQRNLNWKVPLNNALQKDSTLVIVGLGHLFGRGGVIEQLRQSGYTVTPVFKH